MLEKINNPQDLKQLEISQLEALATDIRESLLYKLSRTGGHFGPNFGMVEATIALHYAFDSPKDKFVFDVSHQSYTHKILTGRKHGFTDEASFKLISGYTNPDESAHDFFKVGHTSTSISLASGLAKGRDLKGDQENIIAIIGDGSLSGGEALEGLNFASELQSNFIIIVNDNDMSIAENHGGLYANLKQLRESNGTHPTNLFKAMNLDYHYQAQGNSIEALIETFKAIKDIDHPVVVHINTVKGKGYPEAEQAKEQWHWSLPFVNVNPLTPKATYETITSDYLLEKMAQDPTVVALVAGVPGVIGFNEKKRLQAGKQFVDVGIAEEHAVAMASGIAKNGGKPVFATHSTFFQRTFDQISQDLAINDNPATLLVNSASIYGMRDVTHLGIFDIPLLSNIPNLVYLAPTNKAEYLAMLDWSLEQQQHPVAIRIPGNGVIEDDRKVETDYSLLNTYKVEQQGSKVAMIAVGSFYALGEAVVKQIKNELGLDMTLINPRYLSGIDESLLRTLLQDHQHVITLEDGQLAGGFGEKIASFYGLTAMSVQNYGLKKQFLDRFDLDTVLFENRLTPNQIVEDIKDLLNKK